MTELIFRAGKDPLPPRFLGLQFDSGRKLHCEDPIAIDARGRLYSCYDEPIETELVESYEPVPGEPRVRFFSRTSPLTAAERRDLAEYMIARWTKFAEENHG